jgi:hypothetical protein
MVINSDSNFIPLISYIIFVVSRGAALKEELFQGGIWKIGIFFLKLR